MLREAVQHVKAQPRNQKIRADLFEALAAQIGSSSAGAWKATRGRGTDGSEIFLGRQGEALVIAPDGRLCRGALGRGIVVVPGGLEPDYPALLVLD
jgi:hypothetical protein